MYKKQIQIEVWPDLKKKIQNDHTFIGYSFPL